MVIIHYKTKVWHKDFINSYSKLVLIVINLSGEGIELYSFVLGLASSAVIPGLIRSLVARDPESSSG